MNQKAFVNITLVVVIIILTSAMGYLTFTKKPTLSAENQLLPTANQNVTTPPSNIFQLTKDHVRNGYDQCGVQFKNGEFSLSEDEYVRLEQEKKENTEEWRYCDAASYLSDDIVFADLDSDTAVEALVPARIVRASSGGTLYIFKNVNGSARVIDRIIFGKGDGKIISVNKNTVVVEYKEPGPNGPPSQKATYQFINGHFQSLN